MHTTRHALDTRATLLMVGLCFTWALAQIVLKYTAADMAPTLQIAVRSGGAAILIYLMVRWRKQTLFTLAGAWKPGLVVGALFAGEFFLVGEALRYTTASHVSIFLYSAPIFAALGLHLFSPDERLGKVQWLGVVLAFVGIAISFLGNDGDQNTAQSPNMLLGDALALLAGAFWGVTTVVVRGSRLKHATATETLFYQLVGALVILASGAVLMGQTQITWTTALIGSLLFQIVLVSFISMLVWFWLLRLYLASRLGVLSFMSPLFGVVLGAWLLDEVISLNFLVGAVCVVAGILLVSGQEWFFSKKASGNPTASRG
ncbi:MAG TPA: DMT family transporter [Alcaligenaceae bacterium]|nr:DMT family transporter [Alcaligenaceae bacterium]